MNNNNNNKINFVLQTPDPPSSNAAMVTNLIRYFGENVSEGQPLFSHLVSYSSLIS